MDRRTINLADAKARLSELTDAAELGDEIVITKRGRPVAILSGWKPPLRPLDVDAARELVRRLPRQAESAGEFVRRMRDEDRY